MDKLTPEKKVICPIVVNGRGINLFFHFVYKDFLSALYMDSQSWSPSEFNSVKRNLGSDQVRGVFWISCLMMLVIIRLLREASSF